MSTREATITTCDGCGVTTERATTDGWRVLSIGSTRGAATSGSGWIWDLCWKCYGGMACSLGKHEGYISTRDDERDVCHRCKVKFR